MTPKNIVQTTVPEKPIQLSVFDEVIPHGMCVGCGICAGLAPDALRMAVDEYGANELQASETPSPGTDWADTSLAVCPFSPKVVNEDVLGNELHGQTAGINHCVEMGYYLACFAGHVNDDSHRRTSSSGGMATWLIGKLMASGYVDAAVCVGPSAREGELFEYQIVDCIEDLAKCRKSHYYPVELSRVIPILLASEKRYVFVGIPCYCKGMKLAMKRNPILADRVQYTVGLVCGHLKTRQFAWYLSRCAGVSEDQLVRVDFRKKVEGRRSWDYSFEAVGVEDDREVCRSVRMRDVFCGSWGYNTFMLDACDWCDDVYAEVADVTIGDAWLTRYTSDCRGTNLIVCRAPFFKDLIEEGVAQNELTIERLSESDAIQTQQGGLRHRRQGLAYRLHEYATTNETLPVTKRVEPDAKALGWFHRVVQGYRQRLKRRTKEAFLAQQRAGDGIDVFHDEVAPLVNAYDRLYWWRLQYLKLVGVCKGIGKRLRRLVFSPGRRERD